MAPGEANPFEPQQYKTIVLRTSIYCPGCSKKVKRIIKSIPGIYDFVIDPSLNKVTITGDVEADIIIKKFLKFNKQIELWPEKKLANANTKTNSDKNQSNIETNTSINDPNSEKKPDQRFKEKKPSDKSDVTATATATATATNDDPKIVDGAQEAAAEAPSKSDNGPEMSPNENDPKSQQGSAIPKANDSNKKSENQQAKSSGDSGSKKTEKMVQKEINNGDRATEGMTSLSPLQPPQPPQNMMYNMPTTSYVMSYNMAQPSTTHSYYAFPATSSPSPSPSPPPPSHGYLHSTYSPPPPEFFYGPPSEWGSQAPPPESYHMFNDENANSCNVM